MPPHGFVVGQVVEVFGGQQDGHVPRGAYTVLRQLPNDGLDREYRVRNKHDGHERVLRESQMRKGLGASLI